jgi:hypothetical protein
VVAKKAVATAEATLKVAVAAEVILEVAIAEEATTEVEEEPTAAINKKSYPKLLESMKPE